MRSAIVVLVSLLLSACGGAEAARRAPARSAGVATPPSGSVAQRAERTRTLAPSSMETRGITGSLSTVDVERALSRRFEDFGACFAQHGRRLRTLGGRIQLAFHVARDGSVLSVRATDSTIGHRQVERCIVDVAAATDFPPPQGGGDADFSWPLELDPPEHVRHPDTWDPSRVARVVRSQGPRVLERCVPEDIATFQVTTYVSRSGRVLAAGAIALEPTVDAEPLDCVARLVRRWRMPRAERHQAKVTFELR